MAEFIVLSNNIPASLTEEIEQKVEDGYHVVGYSTCFVSDGRAGYTLYSVLMSS